MADFSIPRPESITPADNAGQDSPRHDQRERRRPRPSPEPVTPPLPEPHDEDSGHQVDELA